MQNSVKQIVSGKINFPPNPENYVMLSKSHNDWKGYVTLRENVGAFEPFVTHYYNAESGGHCWGHYFKNRDDAIADFNERVQRGY